MPRFIGPWRERRWWRLNMPFFTLGYFSPAALFAAGEQGVWYDPSDFSTMFQDAAGTTPVTAVGQVVGLIRDKSGRGNHATQSTTASKPILRQSGARYYLEFDGVDDFLVTSTITPGTGKAQVFAGVRKISAGTATAVIMESSANAGTNAGSIRLIGPSSVGENYFWGSAGTGFSAAVTANNSYIAPISNVLTGIGDIAADTAILRVNGAQAASSTTDQGTGNYLAYPLYIGRRGGTALPFNGRIYGLIARFGANLTAGQISQTETWVNSKTGAY